MKKRAIVSTLASLALAGAMCVGFAACGDNGLEAASIKGEEVGEEVFEKAFGFEDNDNYKNVKFVIERKTVFDADGSSSEFYTKTTAVYADSIQYVLTETKVVAKGIDSEEDLEDFEEYLKEEDYEAKLAEVKDGKKVNFEYEKEEEYYIDSEGNGYVKDEDGKWTEADSYLRTVEQIFLGQLGINSTKFGDYKYNGDVKGYVRNGDTANSVLKYKEDKLKAVSHEVESSGSVNGIKASSTMSFSAVATYGGQSLALPTVE